jgi:hypothetical protein
VQRIGWAIALSAALHALAIVAIKAGPPRLPSAEKIPIEARIALPAPASGREMQAAPASVPRREADEPLVREVRAGPSKPRLPAPAVPAERVAPVQPVAQAGDLPLDSDRPYYLVTSLDRPPVPLSAPDACYPRGATGEVTYELLIDETGVVNRAAVVVVRPAGLFTAAAAELCAAIRFSPAIKDGRAVRSQVRLVVGRD